MNSQSSAINLATVTAVPAVPFSKPATSATTVGRAKERVQFLDAIRGLAATAVVVEHCCEKFHPGYLHWASAHFSLGVFGVATFFLVSGFIIPVSLERYSSLQRFWEARFFRLFPMYWVSLLLAVSLGVVGVFNLPPRFYSHPVATVLGNTSMLQTFFGIPNVIGVYWTLSLELVFYVLCSALFFIGALSKTSLWAWSAIAGNLLLALALGFGLHRSFPAGQVAMLVSAFVGSVLYRVSRRELDNSVVYRILPVLLISFVVAFWFRFNQYPSSKDVDWFTFPCVLTSFTGAYALFGIFYVIRHLELPRFLLWLGRISYSLYLVHGLVLGFVPRGRDPEIRMLLVFVISVAVSGVTFRYIEQPGIAIHQRRMKRLKTSSV